MSLAFSKNLFCRVKWVTWCEIYKVVLQIPHTYTTDFIVLHANSMTRKGFWVFIINIINIWAICCIATVTHARDKIFIHSWSVMCWKNASSKQTKTTRKKKNVSTSNKKKRLLKKCQSKNFDVLSISCRLFNRKFITVQSATSQINSCLKSHVSEHVLVTECISARACGKERWREMEGMRYSLTRHVFNRHTTQSCSRDWEGVGKSDGYKDRWTEEWQEGGQGFAFVTKALTSVNLIKAVCAWECVHGREKEGEGAKPVFVSVCSPFYLPAGTGLHCCLCQ